MIGPFLEITISEPHHARESLTISIQGILYISVLSDLRSLGLALHNVKVSNWPNNAWSTTCCLVSSIIPKHLDHLCSNSYHFLERPKKVYDNRLLTILWSIESFLSSLKSGVSMCCESPLGGSSHFLLYIGKLQEIQALSRWNIDC